MKIPDNIYMNICKVFQELYKNKFVPNELNIAEVGSRGKNMTCRYRITVPEEMESVTFSYYDAVVYDAVAAKAEEKAKKEPKKRERKPSTPKEKKPKTEKAASEVSSNSAPSPAPVTTPALIPSATGDVDTFVGQPCPLCGKGIIIKGKTAYGCSEWRNGCTFRKNF